VKCDLCQAGEAEYYIKKSPPGSPTPSKEMHLCSDCAGKYLKHDTISIVRIARESRGTKKPQGGDQE
jgi:hypothetical protein